MKPVFIASTPNVQKDDLKISRKLLFNKRIWRTGKFENVVKEKISVITGNKYVHLYDTGRASLYSLFKSLEFQPDSEVIIQAFTCLAVPLSIKWAKCKPIYVDITKNFNPTASDIKKVISPKTRAIILQHTFGVPVDSKKVREIIDEENKKRTDQTKIYLIEDLAHCLGSTPMGKYGDVSMLSFGQEKMISCTQGGALVTNSEEIDNALSKDYKEFDYPNNSVIKRNIIHPLLWNLINKTYYFPPAISIGKGLIMLFRAVGLLKSQADPKKADTQNPTVHKLSNAQCMMLSNQLDKLAMYNKHRKDIVKIYDQKLPKENQIEEDKPLLRYPIVSSKRKEIIYRLKSNRIIPGNWYSGPIHPAETPIEDYSYVKGSCPNAEELSEKVFNLPTGINVSKSQAKKIASLV